MREGVPAVTWALTGLLEDARAEALAARELPGLARLWAAQHSATPADGDGFEALLARLARALADAAYDDPHPWVGKGRALFWRDAAQQVLAEPGAQTMRRLASLLGHDIGQMRMGLNPRTYRQAPSYRDDNRWLWHAEGQQAAVPMPAPAPASPRRSSDTVQHAAQALQSRYPEWDANAAVWRRDWCTVVEEAAPAGNIEDGTHWPDPPAKLSRDLVAAIRRIDAPRPSADPGDELHVDGAVRWAAARRTGRPEAAVFPYLRRSPSRRQAAVLLLVDMSASSADLARVGGRSVLSRQCAQAAALAQAMQRAGWRVAIQGFHSDGRHKVRVQRVLDFGATWDANSAARLATLRSALSTRLGAVLRHANGVLAGQPEGARWAVVLGDGEPHDIDVHDPAHLVADARVAVREARRCGVRVVCLRQSGSPVADVESSARLVFGDASVASAGDDWRSGLLRLLSRG
ncbi:hypothetical protein SAMN05444747_105155 [Variovorax sp. OV329]|nr:hypothetical protein SAMN05444747_105155 [Variovorax sp. OV329]